MGEEEAGERFDEISIEGRVMKSRRFAEEGLI